MPFSDLFKKSPKKEPARGHDDSPLSPEMKKKSSVTSNERKKENNRLVLGERDAVLQETRNFGGVYIDPNPGVLEMLKAGNIDPYLVYEKGMLAQIEKKIPRIDFVKADVDALFRAWNGKPEEQIPIPVRQLSWLKNHAAEYGYIQDGNSWILK